MIIVSKVYHRPAPEPGSSPVEWHHQVLDGAEFSNRLNSVYGSYILHKDIELIDELTIKYSVVWSDEAIYEQYKNDPILNIFWEKRDQYNLENNIISDPTEVTHI